MIIYFQVVDRTIRQFLNDVMGHFPFPMSVGETPPGLTDALIFYDPVVKPTRPGHILPATLINLIESGRKPDAEKLLAEILHETMTAALVNYDGEIEMLTIEEEDYRTRIKAIEQRRARLAEICNQFGSAVPTLKDWMPPPSSLDAPVPVAPVPDVPAAPAAEDEGEESAFYSHICQRIRSIMESSGGMLARESLDESTHIHVDMGMSATVVLADVRKAQSKMLDSIKAGFRSAPGRPADAPADSGASTLGTLGSYRVMFICDYIIHRMSEIFNLTKIREIEECLITIRASVADHRRRLARLQEKRASVILSGGLDLTSDLDHLAQSQYRYFALDSKRQKSLTAEEKRQFGHLDEDIQSIEKKIDADIYMRFASSPEFLATLKRLNQAIVQSIQELLRVEETERENKEALAKLDEVFRGASVTERCLKMEEQVLRLKQFAKLLGGRVRRREFTAVTPPPWPVSPDAVLCVLDRFQTMDLTLFPERFLRRRGMPGVLLLPCFGSGLYDWQDGMLVISMYPEKLTTAVLSALAEFRLDADESKEMLNSYGTQIKKNRGLGFVKLKEGFLSDYIVWMEREASGYRVMEKDVRSWFERKIPLAHMAKPGAGREGK